MTEVVLLDIEGTTTPISFVYEVLFPFAEARLSAFLAESPSAPAHVRALRAERDEEKDDTAPPWNGREESASALAYLRFLMSIDRKSTALKAVQGEIWKAGFESGALKAEVYPDVPTAFARWTAAGLRVAIFSSGSVLAQRVLFAHTTEGDLGQHLCGYYDTTTGAKREPEAYRRIAAALGLAPGAVLFVSDVEAELDAAREAGMDTRQCVRPGTTPGPRHRVVTTFDTILPGKATVGS